MFAEPLPQKEKQIKNTLTHIILQLRPELARKKTEFEEEEQESEENENLPFVCHKFNLIGVSDA
jgi:hypothetical protein